MYKRASLGVAAALLLSACGSPSSVTPVQNSGSTNVQSVPVQRTEAASSLATAQSMQNGGPFGGANVPLLSTIVREGAVKMRYAKGAPVKRATFSEADLSWSECSDGQESGSTESSPTDFESGERTFYDAACTQLATDAYIHLTNNAVGSINTANISIAGTLLKESQSGTVVSYDTITGSATGTSPTLQVSIEFNHAANQTASPTAQFGEACAITIESSAPQTCGLGSVAHIQSASADYGVTMTESTTYGSTSSSVSGTVTTYSGAYNALSLGSGTFPAWTVSGGQVLSTATLTGTESDSGSFTLTDSKADATTTMTMSSGGAVTGTIKRTSTGATVATFTTDAFGDGTITYSNGTTATISDWIVTG